MRKFTLLLLVAALASSCAGRRAKISGRLAGHGGETVYLQTVSPYRSAIADSAKLDEKGAFKFRVHIEDRQPTLYNILCGLDLIPLMVSPGQDIKVCAVGKISANYNVENSPESELICRLNSILAAGAVSLDSLTNMYADSEPERRTEIAGQYAAKYMDIKRRHLRFVVENASSLAALYGLYQRLPGDENLFGGQGDIVYYRMVADSVSRTYPDSKYLEALRKQLSQADAVSEMQNMISVKAQNPVSYPDLELPDMYGKKVRLSSLDGKIILLDFWTTQVADCKVNNAELKETYDKYNGRGFEIYQVSLDTRKADWVTSVQQQRLPWITLCDFKGEGGTAPHLYNISRLPSNLLIDRNGNIVAKNLYGSRLNAQIEKLLD